MKMVIFWMNVGMNGKFKIFFFDIIFFSMKCISQLELAQSIGSSMAVQNGIILFTYIYITIRNNCLF